MGGGDGFKEGAAGEAATTSKLWFLDRGPTSRIYAQSCRATSGVNAVRAGKHTLATNSDSLLWRRRVTSTGEHEGGGRGVARTRQRDK